MRNYTSVDLAAMDSRTVFDDLLLDQNTQQFLEYLPVEDWFDKYLIDIDFAEDGGLSAGMSKGARLDIRVDSDPTSEDPYSPGQSGGSPQSSGATGGGALPLPVALSPPAQQTGGDGGTRTQTITTGVDAKPSSSGGGSASGTAVLPTSGPPAVVSGMPDQLPDRNNQAPGQKPKRRRVRDKRQQELNKLAQVRYRERKRAKAEELKREMGGLSTQLTELQIAKKENTALQDRSKFLQDAIRRKEAEIGRVKAQLTVQENGEGASSGSGSGMEGVSRARGGEVAWDTPEDLNALVAEWLRKTEEVKELITLIGLSPDKPSPYGNMIKSMWSFETMSRDMRRMYENAVARLDILVHDVMDLCIRVLRLQGPQIEQLMNADYKMVCSLGAGWKEESKWLNAAKQLSFSREQRERILDARQDMLAKLERIYKQRKALNLQVVQQLLPAVFEQGLDVTNPDTQTAEVVAVLDQLETNLRDEQRALSEQDYITFKQLLTPIQGGLFVVLSFPDHCDCLALLNAVHQLHGDGKSGAPGQP